MNKTLKRILIIKLSVLMIAQSFAQTGFFNPTMSVGNAAITAAENVALSKSGFSLTSATATIFRSNLAKAAVSFVGKPGGWVGFVGWAVVGSLVSWGIDSAKSSIYSNGNNSFSITNYANGPSQSPAITQGSLAWKIQNVTPPVYASVPSDLNDYFVNEWNKGHTGPGSINLVSGSATNCVVDTGNNAYSCTFKQTSNGNSYGSNSYWIGSKDTAPTTCAVGQVIVNGACSNLPGVKTQQQNTVPASGIQSVLTADDLNQPIDYPGLAGLINGLNHGLSTDPNNPALSDVTAQDLANAGVPLPTIKDLTDPQTDPQQISDPMAYNPPNAITSPTTGNAPTTTNANDTAASGTTVVKVDLGPDPGIPQPDIQLETPPDGPTILAPLFNLLPGFNNIQMSSSVGQCPAPSFSMPFFGNKVYSFQVVCDWFDQNYSLLNTTASVFFKLLAIIILLGA
ncbi:hypothetical protein [Burkholderia multivorans]|uniref:hypothetical protein n=1 Tax=Burkholderia multivorans TaxID=87883 RepID=UPI001C25BBCE|nr:hypothetical protein [Burkholderia multivorans]MBU9542856.1 hypothetical protein [Burkholderia multivorans]